MGGLLRTPNFLWLWLAQIVSGLGDTIYNVAVLVTIFERTGSAVQTVTVAVATMLPPVLLSPIAGVVVDRAPRQRVMVIMDLLRAGMVALLLLSLRSGFSTWAIYAVVAGLAAANAFYLPARLSLLPTLVPKESLVRANSLVMSTNQAVFAAGYLLGGVLVLNFALSTLVALDLASFLLAALFVAFIRPPERATPRPMGRRNPFLASLREGFGYLRHHRLPRALVTMELIEFVPHGLWTAGLMLVFVQQALGGTAADWGYQNAIFFGGQLVGALLAVAWASRLARRPGWLIIANALLFTLATVAYALSPSLLVTALLCFVFGPTSAIRDVMQDSLLQGSVKNELLGRVYSARMMGTSLSFIVGSLGFAWLADVVDVRLVFLLGAALYFVTALYALSQRPLRESQLVA
ncbi:MAG: MFS transporter [Anaerolineales bacterium]|nr:MFS transporter [Anaerolineales bacterium]